MSEIVVLTLGEIASDPSLEQLGLNLSLLQILISIEDKEELLDDSFTLRAVQGCQELLTLLARQQALRATIDWSHHLLGLFVISGFPAWRRPCAYLQTVVARPEGQHVPSMPPYQDSWAITSPGLIVTVTRVGSCPARCTRGVTTPTTRRDVSAPLKITCA